MTEEKFTETMKILEQMLTPEELVIFMHKLQEGVNQMAEDNPHLKQAISNQRIQTRQLNQNNFHNSGCQTDFIEKPTKLKKINTTVIKEVFHERPQRVRQAYVDEPFHEQSVEQEEEPERKKPVKEGKIPDMSILRMLETSMEEMIRFEVNLSQRSGEEPFQSFKDVFKKYLLTQYGLPALADKYFTQICNRISELSKIGEYFYAQLMCLMFQIYD